MLKVEYDVRYLNDLKQLVRKQPELVEEINLRAQWFKKNPEDTRLNNHDLKKKMKSKWAFSITGDIRIIYKWLGKNKVRLLAIGGHEKVYKE